MSIKSEIPKEIGLFFWDTDLATLDVEKNKLFIIERLLNMGDEKSLLWLWHTNDEETIKDAVKNSRKLTLKTARCWQNYFELKEEQMRCFSTYSTSLGSFY